MFLVSPCCVHRDRRPDLTVSVIPSLVLFCSFFQVCYFVPVFCPSRRASSARREPSCPTVRGSLHRGSRISHPVVRGSSRRCLRLSHPPFAGSSRRRSRVSDPAVRGSSRHRSRINQPPFAGDDTAAVHG